MDWSISRFRAGDLVEVRSKKEILATLDEHGCVGGVPFMPEMLRFCGQRFHIGAVAHKTCDTICASGGRRLPSTVHLDGVRCDGSAHGGCQAECSLFWKDAWLKPVDCNRNVASGAAGPIDRPSAKYTEAQLVAHTRVPGSQDDEEPRYICQATTLLQATQPLPWWDLRQYLFDILTRNRSLPCVLRAVWLASLRQLLRHTPFGYRILDSLYKRMHRWLMGRSSPYVEGKLPGGTPTPTGRLDLKAGELVRVKSKHEIEKTVDETGRNRGLSFDKEMARFCDGVFEVRSSVVQIIDETTGKMRHMKQPCVMLEGVYCHSEYSERRLMCPRAIPPYWREIWLERVNGNGSFSR
jgi:hypothetical protein